jgi:transposase
MEAICFSPDDWRGWRRTRALELKQDGWRQRNIASALGVSEVCVSRWLALVRQAGPTALRSRLAAGPVPKLTPEQKSLIPEFLWHGAEAYGFRGEVWTCRRIVQVITSTVSVSLAVQTVEAVSGCGSASDTAAILRSVANGD